MKDTIVIAENWQQFEDYMFDTFGRDNVIKHPCGNYKLKSNKDRSYWYVDKYITEIPDYLRGHQFDSLITLCHYNMGGSVADFFTAQFVGYVSKRMEIKQQIKKLEEELDKL